MRYHIIRVNNDRYIIVDLETNTHSSDLSRIEPLLNPIYHNCKFSSGLNLRTIDDVVQQVQLGIPGTSISIVAPFNILYTLETFKSLYPKLFL